MPLFLINLKIDLSSASIQCSPSHIPMVEKMPNNQVRIIKAWPAVMYIYRYKYVVNYLTIIIHKS